MVELSAAGGLPPLDAAGVAAVAQLLRPHVRRTPVLELDAAELGLAPAPLVLKLEHLQHAGSFKARGAFANLLLRRAPPAGVVAASGGNHGAAVAFAAGALGIPATIFVPGASSPAKRARIAAAGARLEVVGATYDEARAAAEAFAAATGALDVPAFDGPATILGAGSLGLELVAQAPGVHTVLAAVGGGGLLAGIATAAPPHLSVVGIEPIGAPTLHDALAAGAPVDAPVGSVALDSLAPRRVGTLTFSALARRGVVGRLVSDEAIEATQRLCWDRLRLVLEPGGCTALAALVAGAYTPAPGEVVAVVLSGANTTAVDFGR